MAGKCAGALGLKMTTVVDDVKDSVNQAYNAWPERIYLIGVDGKIAYKGGIGPFGFKPGEARDALVRLLPPAKREE